MAALLCIGALNVSAQTIYGLIKTYDDDYNEGVQIASVDASDLNTDAATALTRGENICITGEGVTTAYKVIAK